MSNLETIRKEIEQLPAHKLKALVLKQAKMLEELYETELVKKLSDDAIRARVLDLRIELFNRFRDRASKMVADPTAYIDNQAMDNIARAFHLQAEITKQLDAQSALLKEIEHWTSEPPF